MGNEADLDGFLDADLPTNRQSFYGYYDFLRQNYYFTIENVKDGV